MICCTTLVRRPKQILFGPVNLSLYHLSVIHICKQVEPIFCVIQIAFLFFVAGKVIIETFGSILDSVLSFQSRFSQMKNGCDDLIPKTYKPVDTMYLYHLSIPNVFHVYLLVLTRIFQQQTCFSLWIWLVREYPYFLARQMATQSQMYSEPTLI